MRNFSILPYRKLRGKLRVITVTLPALRTLATLMYNDLFMFLNLLNFLIIVFSNVLLITCRNMKPLTLAKVNRDVKFQIALYYSCDICDLLNGIAFFIIACITTES